MSRKTLIKFWIAAAILGALLVGRHAHAQQINFRTLKTFSLTCEAAGNTTQHLIFEVKPSEMQIEMHNLNTDKTLTFPITNAIVAKDMARNIFGNYVEVTKVYWIDFKDNGGGRRSLNFASNGVTYIGNFKGYWSCI